MTALEPKSTRDSRGIDTLERALVYAALLLRTSNTSPSNVPAGKANQYLNAVRIIANFTNITALGNEPLLKIDIKLPYDSQKALLQGGNFVENVGGFGNSPVYTTYSATPSRFILFSIPPDPAWVTTLERYAAWVATNLMAGFVSLNNKIAPPVTVAFAEEDPKEPSISISATLKLDLFKYLDGNNLLEAVVQQVRSGTKGLNFVGSSTLQLVFGGVSGIGIEYTSESVYSVLLSGTSIAALSDLVSTGLQKNSVAGFSRSTVTEQNILAASRQMLLTRGSSSSRVLDGNRFSSSSGKLTQRGLSSGSVGTTEAPLISTSRYKDAVLAKNPVGFWRLSETSGTQALDISGNNRHGTYVGSPTFEIAAFNQDAGDKAIALNGTSQYVDFGNPTALQITVGTMEAWVKIASHSGASHLLGKANAFIFYLVNGILNVYSGVDQAYRSTSVNVANDVPHLLHLTFSSGVTNETKIYIDGNLVFVTTTTVKEQVFRLLLGATHSAVSTTISEYLAGTVDDPAIYNYILTPAQVKENYEAAKPIDPHADKVVLLMHMDGLNGGIAFVEETGKAVTAVGNVQTKSDQFRFGGSSAYFDGTGDALEFASHPDFTFGTEDFTWECWVRPDDLLNGRAIMGTAIGGSGGNAGLFLCINSQKFVFRHWVNGSGSAFSTQIIKANTWYFVKMTKQGANLKIYVNGVEGTLGSTTLSTENDRFFIGTVPSNAGFASDFKGNIDEIRITKVAVRDGAEVPVLAFPNPRIPFPVST